MSAIYGVISLTNWTDNCKAIFDKLEEGYCTYPRNELFRITAVGYAIGKLHQVITQEDAFEKSIMVQDENIILAGDLILDNRNDLFNKLNMQQSDDVSDSSLVLEAYLQFGDKCVNHLEGDYSIVIVDIGKQVTYLFKDHFGVRSLYYYIKDGMLVFSTLLEPIAFSCPEIKKSIEWQVEFLAFDSIFSVADQKTTLYKEVYQFLPSHLYTYINGSLKECRYWNPSRISVDNSMSEEYAKIRLKEILETQIKAKLRSDGDIGVFCSSGLDSSTILCIAADLEPQKFIHSYCFVPHQDYITSNQSRYVENEGPLFSEVAASRNNIIAHVESLAQLNSYNQYRTVLETLKQPYKAAANAYWIVGLSRVAAGNGCKVVLSGQSGNGTLSLGRLEIALYTFLTKGDFRLFYKVLSEHCASQSASKKRVLITFSKMLLKHFMNINKRKQAFNFVKNHAAAKYGLKRKLSRKNRRLFTQKEMILHEIDFYRNNYLSSIEVAQGLRDGMRHRDPSRSKQLVEFILSVPEQYFVLDGYDRSLIRTAMEGVLPDSVRLNRRRGQQSSDWLSRILKDRLLIVNELEVAIDLFMNSTLNHQLYDVGSMKELITQLKDGSVAERDWEQAIILLNFIEFYR